MIFDNTDYEKLANMTDEQAADILENYRVRLNVGRQNGKSIMFLAYNIALSKAIQRLRETNALYNTRQMREGALTPNQARQRLGLSIKEDNK